MKKNQLTGKQSFFWAITAIICLLFAYGFVGNVNYDKTNYEYSLLNKNYSKVVINNELLYSFEEDVALDLIRHHKLTLHYFNNKGNVIKEKDIESDAIILRCNYGYINKQWYILAKDKEICTKDKALEEIKIIFDAFKDKQSVAKTTLSSWK